ncbi:YdaU family protein [Chitinimonas sp.]|uniref:YdaU family protein n=1 Tax=Chitinimonas sp. TaxID=1934313 RepID=UPI0035B1DEE0
MNYYERHLGDYARDAGHLSMLEDGAYTRLLDRYYTTETGIAADQAHRIARARTREEKAAVDVVLAEFFTLTDGVWINQRAEEEIAKAQAKIKAAQENGKRGGRPKKNREETDEKPGGLLLGSEIETQPKAHQTPDTRHHIHANACISAPTSARPARRSRKSTIPDGFAISARVQSWAREKSIGNLQAHFDSFVLKAKARGYTYADWDAALMEAIRENWANLPTTPAPDLLTDNQPKRSATDGFLID